MTRAGSAQGAINNYFSIVIAQVISVPLSLLCLSLITKMLGPLNYGRYALFLASFQFFYAVFINWIRNATIRFGSEEFTKGSKLNKVFSAQSFILSCAIGLSLTLLFILRKKIAIFTGLTPQAYLYIAVFLILYSVFDFICQMLQASHQIGRYALSLVIRQCVILGLVVLVFVFKAGLGPLSLIGMETFSYLAVLLFALYPFLRVGYFSPIVLNKRMLSDSVMYSLPVMLIFVLGYFSLWADTLLLRFFLNFEAVGRYEAANRLVQYISSLVMPISVIAFPMAVSIKTKGRDDLILKYAQRVIPQLSFFWGVFITLLMLISSLLFKVIFGSQYTGSVLIFQVLLVGISFQFLCVMYTALLQSYDFNKALLFIVSLTAALNLSGDLLLIPRIGIIGAAYAKSLSLMLSGLLYMFLSIKLVKIKGDAYKNSIFFLAVPVLLLVTFLISDIPLLRVISAILCVGASYVYVKKKYVFVKEDVLFLQQLRMPQYLKFHFVKIYNSLSSFKP